MFVILLRSRLEDVFQLRAPVVTALGFCYCEITATLNIVAATLFKVILFEQHRYWRLLPTIS